MEKLFAIGDVHGYFHKLLALLEKIEVNFDRDRLIFLGDYIDRGPDSYQVIQYLMELKTRCPQTVFLKGNHEHMLEKYLAGEDTMYYLLNGGRTTIDSYMKNAVHKDAPLIPPEHAAFFKSLRLYFETPEYIFVHAGLKPKLALEKQSIHDLLWIRNEFIRSRHHHGRQVVFGHTPLDEPLVEDVKIGIDTGVAYGGRLTCVQLPQMKFYHV